MVRRLADCWLRLPRPLVGALLMGTAVALTAVNAITVRIMTEDGVHPFVIAFWRNLFGTLMMLPLIAPSGLALLRTRAWGAHLARVVANLGSMVLLFIAIAGMPVADVIALNFTAPLFAALGAVLFLGEIMGRRCWIALAVGFAGALVILRPGFEEVGTPALYALGAAASWAATLLLVKVLSRTDGPRTIVGLNLLMITPISFLLALLVWEWPSWFTLALMASHGILGTLNQLLYSRAFAMADAVLLVPFDFIRLPFVALFAFVLFQEVPDLWVWIGAGVIFLATFDLTRQGVRQGGRPPS